MEIILLKYLENPEKSNVSICLGDNTLIEKMPEDYIRIIKSIGSFRTENYHIFISPLSSSEEFSWDEFIEGFTISYLDLKEYYSNFKYDIYPCINGIIPFGNVDDSYFCWDPQGQKVVVICMDDSVEEFNMSIEEFIFSLVTNNIKSEKFFSETIVPKIYRL